MIDAKRYEEIFDYLNVTDMPPATPEPVLAFGRQDQLIAEAAGDLVVAGLAEVIVITGGIGKDSGDIVELGFRSEAAWLAAELADDAEKRGYLLPEVLLEEKASHGGQNAEFGLQMMSDNGFAIDSITGVIHATSARRLAATAELWGVMMSQGPVEIHIKPSDYSFDASDPGDQKEAAAELLRLADWPDKGLLLAQPDLPHDLVDFARCQIAGHG
jgi:hypothetical protein